jgi:hypothetical protein
MILNFTVLTYHGSDGKEMTIAQRNKRAGKGIWTTRGKEMKVRKE